MPGVDAVVNADAAATGRGESDTAILFPNSFASAWLVTRAGIRERWGYGTDMRERTADASRSAARQGLHQGEYYQHLVRELGIRDRTARAALSIPPHAAAVRARLLAQQVGTSSGRWSCLRPAPPTARRSNGPSNVVRRADLVRDRGRRTCVLVGSRGDDGDDSRDSRGAPPDCQPRVLDLAATTTLPVLAGVFASPALRLE